MEIIELIELLKEPAKQIMSDYKVNASALISIAIDKLNIGDTNEDMLLKDNNVFGIKNDKLVPNTYEDLYSSMKDYILNVAKVKENNTEYLDVNKLVSLKKKKLYKDTQVLNTIIDSQLLSKIDDEVVKETFETKGNVVDIDPEPFMDLYVVRKTYKSKASEKGTSYVKEEAIDICNKHEGYSVYNSKGEAIYTKTAAIEIKASYINIKAGTEFYANSTNLYQDSNSSVPTRAINGKLFIFDNKEFNGRYRVCASKDYINGDPLYIIGYVKKEDIKNIK